MEELKFETEAKKIYIKLEKPEVVPRIVADLEKLKVALFNLVDNAIKYTSKGGVTIKLETADRKLKIIVEDTGMGLSKEEIDKLFNRIFERTKEAQKTNVTGRGIGLYITGQVVLAHNGKIWVESEGKGKGSRFCVELPVS
jgi:signal transduction histidine kinase